eukprot:m.278973 g.278973  ORF g.278973 m.278973 type:complete len:88 (-) comp16320_c0_seq11:2640-2903(-)
MVRRNWKCEEDKMCIKRCRVAKKREQKNKRKIKLRILHSSLDDKLFLALLHRYQTSQTVLLIVIHDFIDDRKLSKIPLLGGNIKSSH